MVHFYLLIHLFKGFNENINRANSLNKSFCIVCFEGIYWLCLIGWFYLFSNTFNRGICALFKMNIN